jgi:hypothetical protein
MMKMISKKGEAKPCFIKSPQNQTMDKTPKIPKKDHISSDDSSDMSISYSSSSSSSDDQQLPFINKVVQKKAHFSEDEKK